MKTRIVIAVVFLAMLRIVSGAQAFEPARLSYQTLCQMARLEFKDMAGCTNAQVSFNVRSKDPGVKVSDIAMYIDAKSGRIPLAIATNGVMTLPVSPELAAENPNIVANQPKGSMLLDATIWVSGTMPDAVRSNEKGLIRYSALFFLDKAKRQIVDGLTELAKEYDVESALGNPLTLHIVTTSQVASAEIAILLPGGKMDLKPVSPGHFVITCDPKLMEQDPWVRLSPGHEWSMEVEKTQGQEN